MRLPSWLQWVKDKWMILGHAMGFVMSRILLTVFWLTVIAAYSMIRKMTSALRSKDSPATYWQDAEPNQDIRFQF